MTVTSAQIVQYRYAFNIVSNSYNLGFSHVDRSPVASCFVKYKIRGFYETVSDNKKTVGNYKQYRTLIR